MVNLLTGPKGSGKTQKMIELANKKAKECNGNVVFIKKTHRDTASVTFDIRTICMDDFTSITNTDEYIGVMKHADISLANVPDFVERLKKISTECGIEFFVSLSADKSELTGISEGGYSYLN